jgi:hypothetical protein
LKTTSQEGDLMLVVEGLVHFPPSHQDLIPRFLGDFEEIELEVLRDCGLSLAGAYLIRSTTGTDLLHLYGPLPSLTDLIAAGAKQAALGADHPFHNLYLWLHDPGVQYTRSIRMVLFDALDTEVGAGDVSTFVCTTRYSISAEGVVRDYLAGAATRINDEVPGKPVRLGYDTLFGTHGLSRLIVLAASEADAAELLRSFLDEHAELRTPWEIARAEPVSYLLPVAADPLASTEPDSGAAG